MSNTGVHPTNRLLILLVLKKVYGKMTNKGVTAWLRRYMVS